ncbi:sodium:calcium antiporter [Helicobacter pylori]|nr:sodium:calcium antiporter [Helicobacter pylori]
MNNGIFSKKLRLLCAISLVLSVISASDLQDTTPEDADLNSVGLVSRDQLKIEIPTETLAQKVARLNDYNDKNVNIQFDTIGLGKLEPNDNLGINALWGIQNLIMSQMMGNYGPFNPLMYGEMPVYNYPPNFPQSFMGY